jgi:23S rRNA pseudouridine955/2504/2580 synthase
MAQSATPRSAVREVVVDRQYQDQRIDNYLLTLLKGVPRSLVYRILRSGEVRVNKGRIAAGYRLQPGDRIRIPPLRLPQQESPGEPGQRLLQQLERAILFEDQRLLVLDKPAGVAVHGGSGVSFGVIEALRRLRPQERHLELVHRLDRETSGCLLLSKKRSALRILHELLRENQVDKRYLALLAGTWGRAEAEVTAPLLKNTLRGGERMVRVDPAGKPSHTRFRRLAVYRDATLVEARLLTGRTHQIRVHAAHLGTPILGDLKYGDPEANRRVREQGLRRLFLHASSLAFRWPGEPDDVFVQAPLPAELHELLESLQKRL